MKYGLYKRPGFQHPHYQFSDIFQIFRKVPYHRKLTLLFHLVTKISQNQFHFFLTVKFISQYWVQLLPPPTVQELRFLTFYILKETLHMHKNRGGCCQMNRSQCIYNFIVVAAREQYQNMRQISNLWMIIYSNLPCYFPVRQCTHKNTAQIIFVSIAVMSIGNLSSTKQIKKDLVAVQ